MNTFQVPTILFEFHSVNFDVAQIILNQLLICGESTQNAHSSDSLRRIHEIQRRQFEKIPKLDANKKLQLCRSVSDSEMSTQNSRLNSWIIIDRWILILCVFFFFIWNLKTEVSILFHSQPIDMCWSAFDYPKFRGKISNSVVCLFHIITSANKSHCCGINWHLFARHWLCCVARWFCFSFKTFSITFVVCKI